MKWLNRKKNDELEHQVDIIASGNTHVIRQHYNNLRGWQIRDQSKGGQRVNPGKTPADQLLDDQWAVLEREVDDFLAPSFLPRPGPTTAAAAAAAAFGHSKLQP